MKTSDRKVFSLVNRRQLSQQKKTSFLMFMVNFSGLTIHCFYIQMNEQCRNPLKLSFINVHSSSRELTCKAVKESNFLFLHFISLEAPNGKLNTFPIFIPELWHSQLIP